MQEELVDREAVTRGKRRLITIFGIMITVLLLGLLLYYVNCIQPVERFDKLYSQEAYDEALAYYTDTLTRIGGNARKAEQIVKDETIRRWQEYQEASVTRTTLEKSLEAARNYENLSGFLEELKPSMDALYRSRDAYEKGAALMDAGEYLAAWESFGSMDKADALYEKGAAKAREAQKLYCTSIAEQARALMAEADYEKAMALADEALKHFPDDPDLLEQKETIYLAFKDYTKQTALARARELLDQGNLEETLRVLTDLQKSYPEDTGISDFTAQYETAYARQILDEARPLFDQGEYEEALAVLTPAHEILPDNPQITELYDGTAGHLPAWLADFASENINLRGTKTKEESSTDTFGNTYGHVLLYTEPSAISMQTMAYTEGREDFPLKKAYTRLLGTLAVKEGSRGIQGDRTGTFRIYGDGTLLLEISGISETSEPFPLSVDVTGVDTLSLTFESGTGLKYLLGDLCVYKTYSSPEGTGES